jgi:hypothetical protein
VDKWVKFVNQGCGGISKEGLNVICIEFPAIVHNIIPVTRMNSDERLSAMTALDRGEAEVLSPLVGNSLKGLAVFLAGWRAEKSDDGYPR